MPKTAFLMTLFQEEQRKEIEKKLEEKFKQEKEDIIRERRQLFQARKQKQLKIRLIEQKMELVHNVSHLNSEILIDSFSHNHKILDRIVNNVDFFSRFIVVVNYWLSLT